MTSRRRAEALGTVSKIALALTIPAVVALAVCALAAAPFAAIIIGAMELKRRSDATWNVIKEQEHRLAVARLREQAWSHDRAYTYWFNREREQRVDS